MWTFFTSTPPTQKNCTKNGPPFVFCTFFWWLGWGEENVCMQYAWDQLLKSIILWRGRLDEGVCVKKKEPSLGRVSYKILKFTRMSLVSCPDKKFTTAILSYRVVIGQSWQKTAIFAVLVTFSCRRQSKSAWNAKIISKMCSATSN